MLKILRLVCTGFLDPFQEPKFLSFARSSSGHHRDLQPHHGNLGYKNDETSNIGNASFPISQKSGRQLASSGLSHLPGCLLSPPVVTGPGSFHWQCHRGQHQETTETTWSQRTQDRVCPLVNQAFLDATWKGTNPMWKFVWIWMTVFRVCSLHQGFTWQCWLDLAKRYGALGLWTLELNLWECRWYFESQPNHLVSFPCMMQETPISCYPTPMSHHHRHMCGYR